MAELGSDCVYLSGECWQDGFSLWSGSADPWTVGDPVDMPALNFDHEFANLIPDAVLGSDDDNEWFTEVLTSACPNSITGCLPLIVTTGGELCPDEGADVLSPTDSGHHSIASSAPVTDTVIDAESNLNDFLEAFEEASPEVVSEDTVRLCIPAASSSPSRNAPLNSPGEEIDDKNSVVEMDVECDVADERPRRIAARRAEIAFVREGGSEFEDDEDNDENEEETDAVDERRRWCMQPTDTTSRRGRTRASEVNRNAMNARINRQKKKAYMASLEAQKARLVDENKCMKSSLTSLVNERDELLEEVKYLKSVLANDSVLANLVQAINGPPLRLSSKFDHAAQKRKDVESDHSYGPPSKIRSGAGAGGICLHVREQQLSVELCHRCARMADGHQHHRGFDS